MDTNDDYQGSYGLAETLLWLGRKVVLWWLICVGAMVTALSTSQAWIFFATMPLALIGFAFACYWTGYYSNTRKQLKRNSKK